MFIHPFGLVANFDTYRLDVSVAAAAAATAAASACLLVMHRLACADTGSDEISDNPTLQSTIYYLK